MFVESLQNSKEYKSMKLMNETTTISIAIRSFAEYDNKPMNLLQKEKYNTLINKRGQRLEGDDLLQLIKDSDGVIAGTEKYTKDVLEKTKKLKVISRVGIGIDNIDMDYAVSKGIKIVNTPEAPSWAVAEHTIALILSLLKKITIYNQLVKKEDWKPLTGYMLRNKVVGVIGLGRIGKRVADMCVSFGCRVIGFDPYIDAVTIPRQIEVKDDLSTLLGSSDIITLHIPSSDETYHFISKKEIDQMKPGSFVINTARGELLDETALYQGLKERRIAGAALDVFENEPYKGPLLDMDNVLITPHVASNAMEARIEMEVEAVNNLISEIDNFGGGVRK